MKHRWRLAPGLLLALVAIPAAAGQAADPKTDFVQALARFSLGLEGTYGDEGSRIRSSLDSMDQELERWDATIRTYEMAMASEVNGAEPQVAARLHAALGGVYLDRSRVADALREFVAASRLDPSRAEVYALHHRAVAQGPPARTGRGVLPILNADVVVHRKLAESYAALGQLEESRREQALYERLKQESLAREGSNR